MDSAGIKKELDRRILDRRERDILPEILERLPTETELKELRKLIEQEARVRWLWSSVKIWMLAAMTIIAFFTAGYDGIKTILKRFLS